MSKDARTIGATRSAALLRMARASTIRRRCAWGTTATSMSPIAATRTTSACGSITSKSAARARRSCSPSSPPTARRTAKRIWPFGVAVDKQGEVYVTDEWTSTVSVFDAKGKFIRKWGTPGSGPGELRGPAGIVCERQRQPDRRRQRQQSPAGLHAGRQAGGPVRQGRQRRRRVQQAVGHHARPGRQHLRRRLEEPPRAEAVAQRQVHHVDRQVRKAPGRAELRSP